MGSNFWAITPYSPISLTQNGRSIERISKSYEYRLKSDKVNEEEKKLQGRCYLFWCR